MGWYLLKGEVPVDWFAVPSGSIEMTEGVPAKLANHPVTSIQGHGAFARGRNLKEAFFLLTIANNSGYVINLARKIKVDVAGLRKRIKDNPDAQFPYPLPDYQIEGDEVSDFADDEELVKEQSYSFQDRGGDWITLRPELTPTLARMIAQRQGQLVYPLRWWSFGPFWRYEKPQKGRTREFFQWNIDLIGVDTPEADAEIGHLCTRAQRTALSIPSIPLCRSRRVLSRPGAL
jgi:hypothetical protein